MTAPGFEPETHALVSLVKELAPRGAVAVQSPLGCVIDLDASALACWLALGA